MCEYVCTHVFVCVCVWGGGGGEGLATCNLSVSSHLCAGTPQKRNHLCNDLKGQLMESMTSLK